MVKLSLTKLAAAVGGMGLVLTAGAGVALAAPDPGPIINSTCSYEQVMAALKATDPGAAAQIDSSVIAQNYLRNFLNSAPPQRAAMAAQIQAMPQAAAYFGTIEQVANTCGNY